ncbi:MAG: hypothetical protein ACQGVC_18065 [Myxococcota bacterium]
MSLLSLLQGAAFIAAAAAGPEHVPAGLAALLVSVAAGWLR